ncbi:MAG: hypothetical protein M1819_001829 [Sarea resinae]|nr:MAG: hypothetical protein M1819_001829 [Sarea resinae]
MSDIRDGALGPPPGALGLSASPAKELKSRKRKADDYAEGTERIKHARSAELVPAAEQSSRRATLAAVPNRPRDASAIPSERSPALQNTREPTSSSPLPPKTASEATVVDEDEWENFEREIAEASRVSALEALPTISADAVSHDQALESAGKGKASAFPDSQSKGDIAAQEYAEANLEAFDRLEAEVERAATADERVDRLRRQYEQIRAVREAIRSGQRSPDRNTLIPRNNSTEPEVSEEPKTERDVRKTRAREDTQLDATGDSEASDEEDPSSGDYLSRWWDEV